MEVVFLNNYLFTLFPPKAAKVKSEETFQI